MKHRYEVAVINRAVFSSVWIKKPVAIPAPAPVVTDSCYSSTKWSIVKQHYAQNATCGPSAFVQAIAEFNVFDITHEEAAIAMGTNVSTPPHKVLEGGQKLLSAKGINTKTYKKTFSELGGWKGVGELIVDTKRTFVLHHCYKCSRTAGHYVALMKVCLDSKIVTVAENLHGTYQERPFSSLECDMKCMTWGDGKSFLIFERI
ncbi:MAG: hypothetical protein Q8M92_07915 [Candidatus Subteraquimicrobiales bacterium]|nr:hypothetical protein [Candidatus Subteraquimicrobiales bacterium]